MEGEDPDMVVGGVVVGGVVVGGVVFIGRVIEEVVEELVEPEEFVMVEGEELEVVDYSEREELIEEGGGGSLNHPEEIIEEGGLNHLEEIIEGGELII